MQKTAIALNTWSIEAVNFWHLAVNAARQEHANWVALTPAGRAARIGLPNTGFTLPIQIPVLEATMRSELINSVLPERVVSAAMRKGTLTVVGLLYLTFQTFLSSEPAARVDGLNPAEAPLKAAKSFSEALNTLRSWRQQILTVVNDLQGSPEPLKLFNYLKVLLASLISSDNAFATEVSQVYRITNIKTSCTDSSLLQFMGLIEIEMSSQAMEEDEERRRRGQGNSAVATVNATAAAVGKSGKGKGKGKGKDKGKGSDGKGAGKKTVCQDYLTDRGCPKGDQCTFQHPRKQGRCLRCGATGHDLSTCRRPSRDARSSTPAPPKANAAGTPSTQQQRPQAKSKGAPRPKGKAKPGPARGGANAAWAVQEASTMQIEEVGDVEMTACHFSVSTPSKNNTKLNSAMEIDRNHQKSNLTSCQVSPSACFFLTT